MPIRIGCVVEGHGDGQALHQIIRRIAGEIAPGLRPPPDPEAVRGAKEWLSRHMPPGQPYRPTVDQPALAARFDLQAARRADSFDKCYREVVRLLTTLSSSANAPVPDA